MTPGSSPASQPGFSLVDHPGARVLARPEAVPWVRYLLESGETLYGAASRERDAFQLPGRVPVWVIPGKVSSQASVSASHRTARWAVRHFQRGGSILPSIMGDRFLKLATYRPFFELRVSETLRERGIPTPRVVAAAVYGKGMLYRADLVTHFVPDSENLAETLFDVRRKGAAAASERLDALRAAGALVRSLEKGGLQHRDLNATNVLLQWTGASPSAHVLDLDRSRVLPQGAEADPKPMLRRLRRSLRKWEKKAGFRLTGREWEVLEDAALG